MDADAIDRHGGSVAETLDDCPIVLDVKGIAVANENAVPVSGDQRRKQYGSDCR